CPTWSRLRVSIRVFAPIRAAAREASIPACPAPTTITSYFMAESAIIAQPEGQEKKASTKAHHAELFQIPIGAPSRSSPSRDVVAGGSLLSDAELAENPVEDVLVGDGARDSAQGLSGRRDVDRDYLRRHRTERTFAAGPERPKRLRERIAMPSA